MKKFITTICCIALALACCFSTTACGKGKKSDLEYVKNKGTLIVGITDYEPMDYKEEGSNEWIGFDADMAKLFAQRLGVKVEFVEITWSQKTIEIASKSIDLIWNGMTISEDLKSEIDFSVAYATNMQVAVIKKSNQDAINSVATVKASSIAVEEGSAGDEVATDTIQASTINKVESQVQALLEVTAGTSQVAIVDYTMAYSIVGNGNYTDLMIVDTTAVSFNQELFGVGARKGSDMVKELNAFFKEQYANGKMAQLATQYVSVALNDAGLAAL